MTSTIKVNNIQNQCGQNIINENSNTITLGASGDTIALASGASQTGFGRTGTVNWQTTPKTANFTAVNGEGYFVNTTSGVVTMTMPSGSAGAIVSIQDYNKTFDSNAFTITPASGEKINGGNADGNLIISTEGQGLTFVYVDSTVGWKTIHENEFTSGGSNFISATGGTETTCGNCKIHTFTGPGTFTVNQIATSCAPTNNVVSYLVVAGGGGAGSKSTGIGSGAGGGGGAGGFREDKSPVTPYTASPLDGAGAITVTATSFPITVGGGGAKCAGCNAGATKGTQGSTSTFSTISSAGGGGGGGAGFPTGGTGGDGGSGGGGGGGDNNGGNGTGNTPSTSPSQGKNGGDSNARNGGGGGGANCGGAAGNPSNPGIGGAGGAGVTTNISGSPVAYAGGGSGGAYCHPSTGSAGTGGGGTGGFKPATNATDGTDNTGGGGGGSGGGPNQGGPGLGGNGGSGVVIIRYKFQ